VNLPIIFGGIEEACKIFAYKLEEEHLQDGFGLLNFETRPRVINPFDGKAFDLNVALQEENLQKISEVKKSKNG
jgi:hypothetical protein